MMWGWGILVVAFCVVMMVLMMGHHGSHGSRSHGRDTAERTLDNRLARGEIDVDEYERLRDALQRARTSEARVHPEA
jgi:uncharacterized membrane protein